MIETEKKSNPNPKPQIHHALALWAATCAEHTLHLFEEKSPHDQRPRLALKALRLWVDGETKMVECRKAAFAAHAAAREATDLSAVAAARASGQAAAVAHLVGHAPHAAMYAAKAASLAVPPAEAKTAMAAERDWQWEQLREELLPLGFPKGK